MHTTYNYKIEQRFDTFEIRLRKSTISFSFSLPVKTVFSLSEKIVFLIRWNFWILRQSVRCTQYQT